MDLTYSEKLKQMLEYQELQIYMLRASLIEGEGSGHPEVFDFDIFIDEKKCWEE